MKQELERVAGRADEIAEAGDIGAVGADTAGVDGKAETLSEIEIDTRVVEFREAEACGRRDAIHAGWIHGPGRAMTLPGTARQLIKLFPIAFVPTGCHGAVQALNSFDAVKEWNVPVGRSFPLTPHSMLCRSSSTPFSYTPARSESVKKFN